MFTLLARATATLTREEGQGLTEYALIVLIAIIPVVGTTTICGELIKQFYKMVILAFPAI